MLVGIILRALGIGALPSLLASGLRVIGQADSGPKCEKPIKEVVGDVGSGLAALYLKSTPLGARGLSTASACPEQLCSNMHAGRC